MQLLTLKPVLIAAWIAAVVIAGLAGHLNSLSSWAVVAGIALFPPIVVMWRLNSVSPTLSESINEARR